MSSPSDPFRDILQSWQYRPVQDPHFNKAVWARLAEKPTEAARSRLGWGVLLPFFSESSSRRTLSLAASVLLVVSVALGSGVALAYDSFTRDQRMATAYAHSIDPLQMSIRP